MPFAAPLYRRIAPPESIIVDGLISRWAFDEGSGGVAGNPYGPEGTLINMDAGNWIAGVGGVGTALDFNGTDEYVFVSSSVPNQPYDAAGVASSGLTFCAFVKAVRTGSAGRWCVLGAQGAPAHTGYSAGGLTLLDGNSWLAPQLEIWDGDYTSLTSSQSHEVPSDVWTHVGAVFDSPNDLMRLYTAGLPGDTIAMSPAGIVFDPVYFDIGRRPKGDHFMNGAIDDGRIYNRPLSDSEFSLIAARNG